jgi:hypothetical protein
MVETPEERDMERIRHNPGGWGVTLGATIALVSLFLVWIHVVNGSGASEDYRAITTFTGQTLMFAAILGLISAIGIIASRFRGRVIFAVLALAAALLLIAAAAWAILDPAGFAKYAADAQALASLTSSSHMKDVSSALSSAFASGELDASVGFGAIVGLVGGLLVALGALLSFAWRPVRVA